jgi:protein-L-isoaspartate(D-aspartate) O-methyltransferase
VAPALVRAALGAGVRDERVLGAIARVPRAGFVPAAHAGEADRDIPLPIPHGQVTTQPSLVAAMVEALALRGGERVLEVGAGYGWQTALLAHLAAHVDAVERWPDLAAAARDNLAAHGVANAEVAVGDGSLGLPERAPFDAIVVAAAFPRVPAPLAGQLGLGGRYVQPVGPGGREEVVRFVRTERGLERRGVVMHAHFVRLYGRHGFPPPGGEGRTAGP